MPRDYYEILGLSAAAEAELIDKAYRILAVRYHPDRSSRPEQEHFQRIQQAYEALSDPARRSLYDRNLLTPSPETRPGSVDLYQLLPLRFEQAAKGGVVRVQQVLSTPTRWVDVQVPRGVEEGQRLRVQGAGEVDLRAGQRGQPGDLVLVVTMMEHPRLRRRGLDLYTDIDVPFGVASDGGKMRVATLDDERELEVPAGTRGGETLRLRAGGLRNDRGQHGDLYAVVRLQADAASAAAGSPAGEAIKREHRMLEKQREAVRQRLEQIEQQKAEADAREQQLAEAHAAVEREQRTLAEQQREVGELRE
ncbi:MAG: DnaJ C-terminal domain-containing protein, partial [Phycisphaeraceae bacterium]